MLGNGRMGKQNGQGTLTLPDGENYVGEFSNGELNGQGAYTWSNGNEVCG